MAHTAPMRMTHAQPIAVPCVEQLVMAQPELMPLKFTDGDGMWCASGVGTHCTRRADSDGTH
jgi:hypothetical protein